MKGRIFLGAVMLVFSSLAFYLGSCATNRFKSNPVSSFSAQQRKKLETAITHHPELTVGIMVIANDLEAAQFAGEIVKILKQAGAKVEVVNSVNPEHQNWIGLGVKMVSYGGADHSQGNNV